MSETTATEATQLDRKRRYLRAVARLHLPGEPDLVHLSLYEWSDRSGLWLTGMALCGRSAEQGPLPEGTEVTCPNCEVYRPTYEAALARESTARASGLALLHEQVREAVKASGLKQTWMARQLGVSEKHLSQLLTGRAGLTWEWADRILELCGMELVVSIRPRTGGGR
jgi:DNA-binding XRE family transcriptional regulator